MVFTSGHKELQLPEFELSFEFEIEKLYRPIFCKNSGEHQTLSLRLVWSRVCVFFIVSGPGVYFVCMYAVKCC